MHVMGKRMAPQNVHILKLGTCENVNIYGKRNVTNMVKDLMDGETFLSYLGNLDELIRVFEGKREESFPAVAGGSYDYRLMVSDMPLCL